MMIDVPPQSSCRLVTFSSCHYEEERAMTAYDPNQQQPNSPPAAAPGYTTVPADAQPTTGGDRWALIALAVSVKGYHLHPAYM
jgi:hypothetical protein